MSTLRVDAPKRIAGVDIINENAFMYYIYTCEIASDGNRLNYFNMNGSHRSER